MSAEASEDELLARAVSGDRDATGRILWLHYDRLARYVGSRIPDSLCRNIDPEDVLSQTFVDVWQHIGGFQPLGPDAFYAWLRTIATRKLLDEIKMHRRAKRGGGKQLVQGPAGEGSSFPCLLDLVAGDDTTPSRRAARREAERALRVALAGLEEHYQQVLRLRYLQALAVADVAARMGRSEGAVLMLCQRALKKLRAAMGNASDYLGSDR
jgi:RNA polymerase sigma-70 factor, ECF subfamily